MNQCVHHMEVLCMKANEGVEMFTVQQMEDYVEECHPVVEEFKEAHQLLLNTCVELHVSTDTTSSVEQTVQVG